MRIEVAGEELQLCPERALYYPAARALLVADVHVGKVETFQRHGVALPSEQGLADLDRLEGLLAALAPESVWVLGDLVHSAAALQVDALGTMTARWPSVSFHLVRGNHDRHLPRLPEGWRFDEHDEGVALGPFRLCHEPARKSEGYALAGHLHPVAQLKGSGDALRLPCFQFGDELGLLPAFTEFSGGVAVDCRAGRTVVIADGELVALD